MPDAACLRISASSTLLVCLTPAHYFRQGQVVFIVELGVLIQTEVCEAFAFFVPPSVGQVSWVALSSISHSDLRFFAFVSGHLLTYSFRRFNLFIRLAARCYHIIVVVVVVIFCLVSLGKMCVAFVERSSADDIVIVLAALEIGFLSFAEFVDVH
jgi:hypothetical protein